MPNRFYLIVTQHVVGNVEAGFDVVYTSDGREFVNREVAQRWGEGDLGHDDFNIATVEGGRIVAFGSGMEDFGPDEDGAPHYGHDLDEIARQIGLIRRAEVLARVTMPATTRVTYEIASEVPNVSR